MSSKKYSIKNLRSSDKILITSSFPYVNFVSEKTNIKVFFDGAEYPGYDIDTLRYIEEKDQKNNNVIELLPIGKNADVLITPVISYDIERLIVIKKPSHQ